MLSDLQIKLGNISTGKVTRKPIGHAIAVNARLTFNEEQANLISSRADGRIEKLYVKETGRMIKRGEPLYTLYSETMLTLQREYLVAMEQYETLGKAESRYKAFLDAATTKLLRYGLTREQIARLGETETLQPSIIFRSPASGIVTEVSASEGQYLAEGATLYKINDIRNLWVEAELYSSETDFINQGAPVTVRVAGFESSFAANVTFLSPAHRANSGITVMRAAIDNTGFQLRPGMQAEVLFTHSTREALAVPVEAVIREESGARVFVQVAKNTFVPHLVKLGLEGPDSIEIIHGLNEGDTVVVTGAYLLYAETKLKMPGHPANGMEMM
jgi:Cu(I)/Ag(I) efflux system membrane fusion protein